MRITAQTMARNSYLTYKIGNGSNFRSNALSSILGNLSQSTNASSGSMFDLAAQFSTLKSNKSVLKAYYGNKTSSVNSNDKVSSLTNKNNTSKTNTAADTAAKELKSSSAALDKAAVKLTTNGKASLFKADEEGNYDMDAIASAVTDFVDSYNATKKAVVNSGNNRAIQTAVSMVTSTASVEKTLNKVGITINNDNTLSLDVDKLKSAKMSDIESLFNGTGSYAYGVAKRAAQINTYVASSNAASGYSSTRGSIIDVLA